MKNLILLVALIFTSYAYSAGEWDRIEVTEHATIPVFLGDTEFYDNVTFGGTGNTVATFTSSIEIPVPNQAVANATRFLTLENNRVVESDIDLPDLADVDDTMVPVADQVLLYNGVTWTASNNPAGFSDPMTTPGDIIVKDVGGFTVRLPGGDDNQVLTIVSTGNIQWQDPSVDPTLTASVQENTDAIATLTASVQDNTDDISTITASLSTFGINDLVDVSATTPITGDVLYYNGANWTNNSAGVSNNSFEVIQAAHGYPIGDSFIPVYHDGLQWQSAQADVTATLATHVITEVLAVDRFTVTSNGKKTYTGHGLADGFWYTSATTTGSITQVSPNISNPVLFVEDANTFHVVQFRASTSSDSLLGAHITYTPTGSAFTLDFNDGVGATVDLETASPSLAMTLLNPEINQNYWIKFIQGATESQVSWPSNFLIERLSNRGLTSREDAIDIFKIWYDGTNYLATLMRDFKDGFLNLFSILLDGIDEYADGGDIHLYDRTNAFSIGIWVKPDNFAANRPV